MKHVALSGRMICALICGWSFGLWAGPESPAGAAAAEHGAKEGTGFAAYLPESVDFYADARQLGRVRQFLEKQGLGAVWEKLNEGEKMREFEEQAAEVAGPGGVEIIKEIAPALLEEEAFVAVRGAREVLDPLLDAGVNTYRLMAEIVVESILEDGFDLFMGVDDEDRRGEAVSKWLVRGIEKIDREKFAIYLGGKVAGERRIEVLEQLGNQVDKIAGLSESARKMEWQGGGAQWSGCEVALSEWSELGKEDKPEGLTQEGWEQLLKTIKSLKVVVAYCVVDDVVVVAAGLDREALVLAGSPDESLASKKAFRFFRKIDANTLYAAWWTSRELQEGLRKWSGYLAYTEGIESALKKARALRREGKMVEAISEFNRLWRLRRKGKAEDFVGVVTVESGLRVETRGGWKSQALDFEHGLRFARALKGLDDRLFLRTHWCKDTRNEALGKRQLKAGKEFALLAVRETMEHQLREAEEDGEGEVEKIRRLQQDILSGIEDLWRGFDHHYAKALGQERALVVDLEGKMIPAIALEEEVVEQGKIPRVAYLHPVVKRDELGNAWELWSRAGTNYFGMMAEAFEQPIPFPDTMSADKDDLRTHFFSMPFGSDDFLPSVSVSDELFIIGSSKSFSEMLYEHLREAEPGESEPGFRLEMNTDVLWDFCEAWLEVKMKERKALEEMKEEGAEPFDHVRPEDDALEEGDGPNVEEAEEAMRELQRRRERLEKLEPGPKVEGPLQNQERLKLPEGEFENPLLKDLLEEEGPEVDLEQLGVEDPELARPDVPLEGRVEIEGEDFELMIPEEDEGFPFESLFGDLTDEEIEERLREILGKARWLRGLSGRVWQEDEVLRSVWHLKWAAPDSPRS